jgi:hypothetical protein
MMLPFCGHSLCKKCLEQKAESTNFQCLLCGSNYQFKSIDHFPINESLLHIISYIDKDKNKLSTATPTSSQFIQRVPSKSSLLIKEPNPTIKLFKSPLKKKAQKAIREERVYVSKLSNTLASNSKKNLEQLSEKISTTFQSKQN